MSQLVFANMLRMHKRVRQAKLVQPVVTGVMADGSSASGTINSVTPGSTLFMIVSHYTGSITCSDAQGSYTKDFQGVDASGDHAIIFRLPNANSGTHTVNLGGMPGGGSGNWLAWSLFEISGLSPASPVLRAGGPAAAVASGTTFTMASANQAADAFVLAICGQPGSSPAAETTNTGTPTGYTNLSAEGRAWSFAALHVDYKIVHAIQNSSVAYSWTNGEDASVVLATYRLA